MWGHTQEVYSTREKDIFEKYKYVVLEPWTTTGSELFSHLTCLHTCIFILLSILSLVETISLKILVETPILACEMFTSGFRLRFENIA